MHAFYYVKTHYLLDLIAEGLPVPLDDPDVMPFFQSLVRAEFVTTSLEYEAGSCHLLPVLTDSGCVFRDQLNRSQ